MINWIVEILPPDNPWNYECSVAFRIGTFEIKWYGIFIMLGFALAIFLACMKMWKRYKINIEPFYWFILIGVPTAILGARLGSCIIGDADWASFFDFRSGGLAIEWGVLLTVIVAFIYFTQILKKPKYYVRDYFAKEEKVKRVSFWLYADAVMPCILIAQFLGRWGNYFNQELYGNMVTNEGLAEFLRKCLPWMWVEDGFAGRGYYQPLFLWEGLINIAGFGILYFGVEFINQRKAGDMAAAYPLWYGIVRLCLEPLRAPAYKFVMTYVLSAIFVVVGLVYIILNHTVISKRRNKELYYCRW